MDVSESYGPPEDPRELWRETRSLLALCFGGILVLGLVVFLLA